MSDAVTIRPYQGAEEDASIRALIGACYADSAVPEERFRHWHFGLSTAVQGMIVAEAGGEVVGIQPMEIVGHRLAGRPLLAGVLTGVMVHPDWRRQGIFRRLVAACEERAWESGADLVWTMPNDRSLPGFLKAGYRDPGERRLMLWSPRPSRLFSRKIAAPLANLAGKLVLPFVGRRSQIDARCRVRQTDSLGEQEAEVFSRFASSWSGLVQVRSSEWLAWRFGAQEWTSSYQSFLATDPAGQPAAWAVTAREQREGYRAGYLLDMLGVDEAASLAAGCAALHALADADVDLVMAVVSNASLAGLCRRLGFVAVPAGLAPKRFFTVFRPRPESTAEGISALGQIGGWYQTLADWDNL